MSRPPSTAPRPAAPVKPARPLYDDVGPEELAREEASDPAAWPHYLGRMLGEAAEPREASAAD